MVANTGKPTQAAECSARNGKHVSIKSIYGNKLRSIKYVGERNNDFEAN